MEKENTQPCDHYINAWDASSISAELTKEGMNFFEKEEFEKAHIYFELALQFQPGRKTPRKKLVEMSQYAEIREKVLPEIKEIAQNIMGGEKGKKGLLFFNCPQCGARSLEGVRTCPCGMKFRVSTQEEWTASVEKKTNGNGGGPLWPLYIAFLVVIGMLGVVLYHVTRPRVITEAGKAVDSNSIKELKKLLETNRDLVVANSTNLADISERFTTLESKLQKTSTGSKEYVELLAEIQKLQGKINELLSRLKGKGTGVGTGTGRGTGS